MSDIAFTVISPIVPVRNLDAALDRYRRLGFAAHAYDGPHRYGFADRGSISIHLTEWPDHDPLHTAASVYLYVSDADALYDEWTAAGVQGRFVEPAEPGHEPPGHLWRWELEPVDESHTRVTRTYDWSRLTDEERLPRARAATADKLQASLSRLAGLAERS